MKKFSSVLLAVLLIFSCWTVATAESTDAVSGAPLDNDIEIVYKEHFDDMVTRYADELTEAELLVSADVYDAIGMIRFDSEDSLAARQRIYGIASADDLHAILTGYFDPNDAAYTADTALDARLQAILAACGLNPEDYDISVIRNLSGMPEPITSSPTTYPPTRSPVRCRPATASPIQTKAACACSAQRTASPESARASCRGMPPDSPSFCPPNPECSRFRPPTNQ